MLFRDKVAGMLKVPYIFEIDEKNVVVYIDRADGSVEMRELRDVNGYVVDINTGEIL